MSGERQLSVPIRHEGPDSGRCFDALCSVLRAEPGIHEAVIDRPENMLRLRYDPALVSLHWVQSVARRLGVELGWQFERVWLRVKGLRCAECMKALEDRVRNVPGVTQATVNPAAQTMAVEVDVSESDLGTIEQKISEKGYAVRTAPRTKADLQREHERDGRVRSRMAVSTALCLGALLVGWVGEKTVLPGSAALLFYVIAYVAGGYHSTYRAVTELRRGGLNVDLLMITAALGAAAIGDWPEGAVLLFLFSLSNTLEHYVLGRTRRAIESLMDLSPEEAVVVRDGREQKVSVDQLRLGDSVIVRPGERIAADGTLVSGQTTVDQSPMTGESVPVEKSPGDPVFAGTLNLDGAVSFEVTRLASDSTLARIVRLVEEAQNEKAQSHRFTDWFGRRYTVAVIAAALVTLAVPWLLMGEGFSHSFYRAMTVLVVASPCAVVISIPAAILSAIACAARNGVLFKGGIHLEEAAELRAMAFDKTGTLTLGRPKLAQVKAVPAMTSDELLRLAASVESLSEHPLSRAVVEAARLRGLQIHPATDFQALIGKGVRARVQGRELFVGKPGLFAGQGASIPPELAAAAAEGSAAGGTSVYVGEEKTVFGVLVLIDTLRDSAAPAIEGLRSLGIRPLVMLTGDGRKVAETIAGRLEMDFEAELLPEDKLRVIHRMRKEHGSVAMVGDGINDAPSLAAANLGVSLGGAGTDVALETADIVLMGGDLNRLSFAIRLARSAKAIIRQNLVFAFGVMGLLLAVTFFGSLRLPWAVVGHEGSTVLVILNGLRLLTRRA